MATRGMNGQVDDGIIKEGYVELQKKGAFGGSGFKSRYLMVKKSGTVELFQKQPSEDIRFPKETFKLQGDEDIHSAKIYKDRYRIEIIISEQKKKQKWLIAFETLTEQKSWLNIFRSVHKHIHALARLQEVLSGSNVDTMEGQLIIAEAFADCGHLVKSDKIYRTLITNYNASEAHEQYETFLSSHCNDLHRAEQHFVHRLKFFCLPKEIRDTKVGLELSKIWQRIEYLGSMKQILRQPKHAELVDYQIEYKNIENIWPCYLYHIPSQHLERAHKLVAHFFNDTNKNIDNYKYEYTYHEMEAHAWHLIKQCISGKKGVVKLQSRLELVMRKEELKKSTSARVSIKLPQFRPKGDIDVDQKFTEQQETIPIQQHRSSKDFAFPPSPSLESFTSAYKSEDMMDILQAIDYLDMDFDDDDDMKQNTSKRKESITLSPNEDDGYRKITILNSRNSSSSEKFQRPRFDTKDALEVLDPRMRLGQLALLKEESSLRRNINPVLHNEMFDVFRAIHNVLYVDNNDAYDIFPWTLFMLIWSTRRDEMMHMMDNEDNTEHIQVILEFVYIFVRGCMQQFEQHRTDYTLLLQTLYAHATTDDHEDVQYKMRLSGVRVLGCDITTTTKREVCKFMAAHHWLDINSMNKEKESALHKYFDKGLRDELKRIHDALDVYYNTILYMNEEFDDLKEIRTKTHVRTEISTQCHDKIQGVPTWGPRFENKYNLQQFAFVCQHRRIAPVPKPVRKQGDFDECFLLFCLSMAEKLNPCFQAQIKAALYGVCEFEHYEKAIKERESCMELLQTQLKSVQSPKAARILDYCRCVVAFENVHDLLNGFRAIDNNFKICKIVNIFAHGKEYSNINNYQYMMLYIVCKHPQYKLIKLICEIRLVLKHVHDLYEERKLIQECFGVMLSPIEMRRIQKEIVCGAGHKTRSQKSMKKRSATHK